MEKLIAKAKALGASDLHFGQDGPVWARILGRLQVMEGVESEDLAPILTQVAAWEKTHPGTTFSRSLADGSRLRIHPHRSLGQLRVAIRLLPGTPPPLAALGLPLQGLRLDRLASGLVLICGATGSGKSTTLASLLQDLLQRRPCHVLTFEDPVEYLLDSGQGLVSQSERGKDFPDFPQALRSAVRSDPDVIMVGEMRDEATARAALSLADTGHLVLSSLHASSVTDAIHRLFDLFPSQDRQGMAGLLAASLKAIVAQCLVPHAREPRRVALAEVLLAGPGLSRMIRDRDIHQIPNYIQAGRGEGMVTFDHSLYDALQKAHIAYEDAIALARDPDRFRQGIADYRPES